MTMTARSLQWLGLSNQQTLLPTENHLQCQKWSPYNARGTVSIPIRANTCIGEKNGPASADQSLSIQPAKTATMCIACYKYALLPPPIPNFCWRKNFSPKWITVA